jgi:ankyrin repeat protein
MSHTQYAIAIAAISLALLITAALALRRHPSPSPPPPPASQSPILSTPADSDLPMPLELRGRCLLPGPPTRDRGAMTYVHLAQDGRVYLLPGNTGDNRWSDAAGLADQISRVQDRHGFLMYHREDPEHEMSPAARANFDLILASGLNVMLAPEHEGVRLSDKERLALALKDGPIPKPDAKEMLESWNAVTTAIAAKDFDTLRAALEASPSASPAMTADGIPALALAARLHRADMVALLLEHGADPNRRPPVLHGHTPSKFYEFAFPLLTACSVKDAPIVHTLLEAGANPEVCDPDTRVTALMVATTANQPDIIRDLILYHANLESQDKDGQTALMYAANRGSPEAAAALIAGSADVNATDHDSNTPLMFAAQQGNTATIRALLAAGANPSAKNSRGNTPLQFAQARKHPQAAAILQAATK